MDTIEKVQLSHRNFIVSLLLPNCKAERIVSNLDFAAKWINVPPLV